jgi:hypothetical protein
LLHPVVDAILQEKHELDLIIQNIMQRDQL